MKDHTIDAMLFIADAMGGGVTKAAERLERSHQQAAVVSRNIPKKGAADLVALGFELGPDVDGLFRQAKWPAGWSQRASDHAMWSFILDPKERRRASVFYKGSFWDREAFVAGPLRRFECGVEKLRPNEYDFDAKAWRPQVEDRGLGFEPQRKAFGEAMSYDDAKAASVAWLDANRPGWGEASTYWDDESANLPESLDP